MKIWRRKQRPQAIRYPCANEFDEFIRGRVEMLSHDGSTCGHPFVYQKSSGRYRLEYLEFYRKSNSRYQITLYYVVMGTSHETQRSVQKIFSDSTTLITEIRDWIIAVMKTHHLCPDCLEMIPPDATCDTCMPYRIVADKDAPPCCICLEPSVGPTLDCGHIVHTLCLVRMNPFDHFHDDLLSYIPRKCPVCRQRFSMNDHRRIFYLCNDSLKNVLKRIL